MARQTINTGTAANDNTGDTLRAAGTKINANFSEIYTVLGGDADTLTTNMQFGNNSIVAEGTSADDYETTLTFTNPTADRTITFPDATGTALISGSQTGITTDFNTGRKIGRDTENLIDFATADNTITFRVMVARPAEGTNIIPEATLTLLTEENKKAKNLIEKYEIQNAQVRYVSLGDLNEELLKYKYGFLLRKDIKVNNVSTPTKMNSYLSSGVIPIYTDAIKDFLKHIDLNNFNIRLKSNNSIEEMANTILSFENNENDISEFNIKIKKLLLPYKTRGFATKINFMVSAWDFIDNSKSVIKLIQRVVKLS